MGESEVAAKPTATPKKAKSAKPKKPKTAPTHPKVADMVIVAISTLKERGGSSTQAIKKYIASEYKVDVVKLAPFIKKHLKNSVASGALVQTKGKGASGSFRMKSQTKEKTSKPKSAAPKAKKAAKPAKAAKSVKAKKPAKPKTPKKAAAKKPKAKPAKSPKKAKATKPKSPKPKKAKTAKKSPAKKAKK